jgi:glycosyltransferase involved in cell wall biosynthesis
VQVTFDDQVFTFTRRSGVARYFTELLRIYRAQLSLDIEALTPFRYVISEHLLELDPVRYRRAPLPEIAQRPGVLRPLNRLTAHPRKRRARILHHTHYFPDALEVPTNFRVCTIYDMIPELFPEHFPNGSPHGAKRRYVDACDAILCISQTTKNDLLRLYGAVDKPVVVTPLGVSELFFDPPPRDRDGPDYVLHVGQRFSYKNFDVLLRALGRLASDRPSLSLVCVGPPFDATELARLDELGLRERVQHRVAADEELPALFASALCFVFPSLYEGFGLPIVEAFAAGCPVILADMPCSTEVGGGAAQYFAHADDEGLAALIDQMAGDPATRARWADLGRSRARDFSWRRTAELTRDVYRDLAADG